MGAAAAVADDYNDDDDDSNDAYIGKVDDDRVSVCLKDRDDVCVCV